MKMVLIGAFAGLFAGVVFYMTKNIVASAIALVLLVLLFLLIFREKAPEPAQQEPPDPSQPEAILQKLRDSLAQIADCGRRIEDEQIRRELQSLLVPLESLQHSLQEHPEKAANARSFITQLLPALVGSLMTYATLESRHIQRLEQRNTIVGFIRDMAKAAQKQVENLYRTEALHLDIDAKVSRSLLQSEGLLEDELYDRIKGGDYS